MTQENIRKLESIIWLEDKISNLSEEEVPDIKEILRLQSELDRLNSRYKKEIQTQKVFDEF